MKTILCLLCFLLPLTAFAAPTREPLTPDNVQRLSLAWTYDTRDPTSRLGATNRRPSRPHPPMRMAGYISRHRWARWPHWMRKLAPNSGA